MATIDFQCSTCSASFREGKLDKDGKCPTCVKLYPTCKNKADMMALNRAEIHLEAELTEDRVRQIIKQEINEALYGNNACAGQKAAQPEVYDSHKPKQETKNNG